REWNPVGQQPFAEFALTQTPLPFPSTPRAGLLFEPHPAKHTTNASSADLLCLKAKFLLLRQLLCYLCDRRRFKTGFYILGTLPLNGANGADGIMEQCTDGQGHQVRGLQVGPLGLIPVR